jgi:hypothetical protein
MLGSTFALTNRVTRTVSADGENVTFSGECLFDKHPFSITTKLSDANRWINGESIQNCFPHLSADDREILLSGISASHWNTLFPPEDEE